MPVLCVISSGGDGLYMFIGIYCTYFYFNHAAYDMSSYLRRYGKYLNCVTASYRALAMDVCRLPKG